MQKPKIFTHIKIRVMHELIPITMFIGAFAMVFGIRYLANKEKMAMIERGINPGVGQSAPKPFISLKFGLLMIGLGLGLMVGLFTSRALDMKEGEAVAVYFGNIFVFGGIG
ncbi:MAG: hypothetical protein EOP48_29285, partial [Sphingobacteriales bacterium]